MDQVIDPTVHFVMKVVGLEIVVETAINDKNVNLCVSRVWTDMQVQQLLLLRV